MRLPHAVPCSPRAYRQLVAFFPWNPHSVDGALVADASGRADQRAPRSRHRVDTVRRPGRLRVMAGRATGRPAVRARLHVPIEWRLPHKTGELMVRPVSARLVLLMATIFTVSACNTSPNEPDIAIDARLDGTAIKVEGRTDLEDGTQLQYSVWRADRPFSEGFGYMARGSVVVAGKRFSFWIDTRGWPSGPADVVVMFSSDTEQPAAVVSRYGEQGELLRGPHVANDTDGPYVIVEDRVQLNGR